MADGNKYNITIECGADFVLPFTWYDDNGTPVDLTGATVEAQLRETSSSADAYDIICTHNGAGGRITLTLPQEVTSDVAFSYGVYDVYVNLPGGGRKRPLFGDVYVQDHVTKPIDGELLYMIGINSYDELPSEGIVNRLYFCYDDRKIYRWNGSNYIATAVGNGIQRIDFIEHTSEFTDLYRVTYDDGTTWDYTVTTKGIESIELIGSTGDYLSGTTDTYRLHFNNGTYYDYDVHDGRVVFPVFDIDWETGMLYCTDDMANITFTLDETTGMLSYSY